MKRRDLIIAPAGEACLIAIAALCGWLMHRPLIFASLGPTAYELVETPERLSARPYNIFVGHLIAVLCGFLALYVTGAASEQSVSLHGVPQLRVWAAVMAVTLTVLATLIARATQPAALSTTLLVSLGMMQQLQDGVMIMSAVTLMIVVGEPLRRWRLKSTQRLSIVSPTGKTAR